MRFVCDIDNVIVDWQSTWSDLYTLWFDREVDPALLDTWDACIAGTHFETMGEFFDWFHRARGWELVNQHLVPGALGALHLLSNRVDLALCTARPYSGEAAARDLSHHIVARATSSVMVAGPPVYFKNAQSKHLVPGGHLWLDDSPEVLTSLVENGKRAIRFDQPWNRDLPKQVEKELYVAHDWHEVVEIVKKEAGA